MVPETHFDAAFISGTMYQDVVDLFDDALATGFVDLEHDTHQQVEKGHGRLERRQYWTISGPACIAYLNAKQAWTGLRSIGMVEAQRTVGEQVSTERSYYLTSLPGEACAFGAAVRSHWGVENDLHWVLDIAFQEDASRMRHQTTVSTSLWCCATWRSISSNGSRRPCVASKPDDSKLGGVTIICAESSPPNF